MYTYLAYVIYVENTSSLAHHHTKSIFCLFESKILSLTNHYMTVSMSVKMHPDFDFAEIPEELWWWQPWQFSRWCLSHMLCGHNFSQVAAVVWHHHNNQIDLQICINSCNFCWSIGLHRYTINLICSYSPWK